MIRIAVDAMGGDYAPAEIVKGAVMATRAGGIQLILVGKLDPVQAELKKHDTAGLQIECVRAAVLSVGAEKGKGNELAKETYALLEQSGLKFIGNVEGHDIAEGKANVIVCDGFVGNILVKFSEGIGSGLSRWLQSRLQGRLPTTTVSALCSDLLALTSVAEVIGGGPLWGVKGVSCVMHGRGRAEQVAGCITQAKKAVETGLITALNAELARASHNKSSLGGSSCPLKTS